MNFQFDRLEGRYLQDMVGPVFPPGYIQGSPDLSIPAEVAPFPSRPDPDQPPDQPPIFIDPMDPLSPPIDATLDQC